MDMKMAHTMLAPRTVPSIWWEQQSVDTLQP